MSKLLFLLKTLFFLIGILIGGLFISGYGYLIELGVKVIEIGRTTAGLEDYMFFDVREINKSDNPIEWPLHENYNFKKTTKKLQKLHKDYGTVAFLILKNDSIWHEQYFEGFNKKSKTNSFSMIKTIVAASLGKAIEEGHIKDFNQRTKTFLPWLKGPYADLMTVGDLAKMSSGLDWEEDYFNLLTITPKTYITRDIKRVMKSVPVISEPGEKFIYQSGSTQLLALVLAEATGETISDLVRRYFWNPLGAIGDANWRLDSEKNGVEKSYCCFNSNARDFARFAALFKNGGIWNGEQLISKKYVELSITPQLNNGNNYGLGWWLGKHMGKQFFSMRGHNGQYVIVFPNEDVIIVRLGRQEFNGDDLNYMEETFKMLESSI